MIFFSFGRDIPEPIEPFLVELAGSVEEFNEFLIDFDTLVEHITLNIIEVCGLLQESKIDVFSYSAFLMTCGAVLREVEKLR